MRKLRPAERPVDDESISLYRLAEACNNDCPMCSNSGRPEAWFTKTEGLLERVAFLHGQGFRRVVLTGGEPTIHPGFWDVVAALGAHGMTWDVNTMGGPLLTPPSPPAPAPRGSSAPSSRCIATTSRPAASSSGAI